MSMTITTEDVEKIAALSRLHLSDQEIAVATRDLANVLDHFSSLQNIDTADVPSASDVSGQRNIVREDTAAPDALTTATELLQRAPVVLDRHVKVPAVF